MQCSSFFSVYYQKAKPNCFFSLLHGRHQISFPKMLKFLALSELTATHISSSDLGLKVRDLVGHHVVEGVVAPLQRLLVSETGLLKKVDHHVRSRQLSGGVEVNPAKSLQTLQSCRRSSKSKHNNYPIWTIFKPSS